MTIRQGHNVIAGSSGRQLQDAFPLFFDHRFTFDPQDIRWVNSEDYSWLDGEVYRGGYNKLLSQYQPTGIFKATSLNYTCVFSDLSIVETNVPVATGTLTDLQDWATAAGYTTTGTTIEELVVQKSLVSSSETIAEVVISFYRCYDKKKIALTDQIAAVEAIYAATGVAEYFILDIANKQFKLPRNKWGKYGAGSGDLGDYIEESLPNFEAQFSIKEAHGRLLGVNSYSGAVKVSDTGIITNPDGGNDYAGNVPRSITVDPSVSVSSYKNDAPVQPRGARGDLYFYLGDSDADIVGKAYVTDALIQSKANNSEVLHKTLNESFTGTKTGQGTTTPIALKRHSTYTEIQTQKADGTRTGGFRSIQDADSTVTRTLMYAADGSSFKGEIAICYDYANSEVWTALTNKVRSFTLKKQNSTFEGGELGFESGDTEVNAGKSIYIDRYNGKIRVVGQNSSGTTNKPLEVDIQNNRVDITNAYISASCHISGTAGANGFGLHIEDDTSRNNIYVLNYITADGTSYGRLLNNAYDKSCYIDTIISSAGERSIHLLQCDYALAPTPSSATDNSTKIATTGFMVNKLHHNAVNGGRVVDILFDTLIATGNITLAHPYTDYDELVIVCCDDSANGIFTQRVTTWELNIRRSYGKPWMLFSRSSTYWFCKPESTTTSFIVNSENAGIYRIYGIKY